MPTAKRPPIDRGPSLFEVVRRLMPGGSRGLIPGTEPSWNEMPLWPPDLFAVAATLVSTSGCYARSRYTAGGELACLYDGDYGDEIDRLGRIWREARTEDQLAPLRTLEPLWRRITDDRKYILDTKDRANRQWWDAAIKLMAVADAASEGLGFFSPGNTSVIAQFVFDQHAGPLREERWEELVLPYLPDSMCLWVRPGTACVQPKTRTPQLGCTARSLSHHLALLPPLGEVQTRWYFTAKTDDPTATPMNILVVPFPYEMQASCFQPSRRAKNAPIAGLLDSGRANFFEIDPRWLRTGRRPISATTIANHFMRLIKEAEKEVGTIHTLVLPEGALRRDLAEAIARILVRRTRLEIFIAGCMQPGTRTKLPRNEVYSFIFSGGEITHSWSQAKHHRWRLDRDQVVRYHLGSVLDPERQWWEMIDVADRECRFFVFRGGACLGVLICEDLARIDPVQSVVRAIGPNLLIALLMDGPQLEKRWPARYATVLADDPGSAVLTLTSLALIRRSNLPSGVGERKIALWKDSTGVAKELPLPQGAHALVLTVTPSPETTWTSDGRSDGGATVRLSLTGSIPVADPQPPPWARTI